MTHRAERVGQEIGRVADASVRMWDDGAGVRYCYVGHSHWNPASFFALRAAELALESARYRQVADLIAKTETTRSQPGIGSRE